jgi:hypothetical protein
MGFVGDRGSLIQKMPEIYLTAEVYCLWQSFIIANHRYLQGEPQLIIDIQTCI